MIVLNLQENNYDYRRRKIEDTVQAMWGEVYTHHRVWTLCTQREDAPREPSALSSSLSQVWID